MVGEKFASARAAMTLVGLAASAVLGCERLIDARWDEYIATEESAGAAGGGSDSTGTGGAGGSGGGSVAGGSGGSDGGTGGGPPPVQVTWPDSPTKRCSNGTTVLEACPGPSEPFF